MKYLYKINLLNSGNHIMMYFLFYMVLVLLLFFGCGSSEDQSGDDDFSHLLSLDSLSLYDLDSSSVRSVGFLIRLRCIPAIWTV